ncbi:MAG: hypothetical protein QOD94_1097 [Alphaproteobacteria bacterium]|nr:hypothetical protein [Alphaproteobacteria bacterium]
MGWGTYHALLRISAAGAVLLGANPASAHVKWFASFDVAGSPKTLDYLFLPDFISLTVLALLVFAAGSLLEESALGSPVMRALDRATAWLRVDADRLVRAVCAFFFVALWTLGGVIMTPELKTTAAWIPWLQFAMAIALIWRKTAPLAALGIVVLFAYAIWNYGVFHLADYPIFLGVAVYLALTGLQRDLFGIRPLDILRWTAGVTLMWASVEKWAYPQWSYPLFLEHPSLTLGYEDDFFMRAAGVIEFTLAFALLWTPLVRRCAAIVLTGMFIGACFEFGKLDVIGHAPIIIVLLVLAGDDARMEVRRKHLVLAPVGYAAALVVFLALYYGGHAALFNSSMPIWAQAAPARAAPGQVIPAQVTPAQAAPAQP